MSLPKQMSRLALLLPRLEPESKSPRTIAETNCCRETPSKCGSSQPSRTPTLPWTSPMNSSKENRQRARLKTMAARDAEENEVDRKIVAPCHPFKQMANRWLVVRYLTSRQLLLIKQITVT